MIKKGKMVVYGCGGAGINVARHIANRSQEFNSDAFADREIFFLDTSASNLGGLNSKDPNVYVYEDADGAGKNRRHVANIIMENVNPVSKSFLEAPLKLITAVLQLLTTDISRNLELLHSRRTDTHWRTNSFT
jgi:hypothetical protein